MSDTEVIMQQFAKAYRNVSNQQFRDELVLQHLDYVSHILNRIVAGLPDGVDIENLQSAGVVGLIEAASKYDASRNVAFKTFSYPRIRGAIIDELRANSPLSQKMMDLVKLVREAMENLEPPYTAEAIGIACNLPVEKVEEGLEAMRMNPHQWDSSLTENSKSLWEVRQPDDLMSRQEKQQQLADAIEALPERERLAVTLYYLEGLKLKEIGEVLSISESRASRVLAKAEMTLRQKCGVEF